MGTYWTTTGGTDMAGTFSTNVNFTSKTLSDFNMKVWENPSTQSGKHAFIQGATGNFASSTFNVTAASGTWELFNGTNTYAYPNPGEVQYRAAAGSLYGPNGEKIGGAWGMKHNSENAAAGIFVGGRY
jgi:hypothetical protein